VGCVGCVWCVGCVGGVGGVWGGVGGVGVWGCGGCGVLSCGVTPYVRHSTDCTCCDFGHLRFYYSMIKLSERICQFSWHKWAIIKIERDPDLIIDQLKKKSTKPDFWLRCHSW
jgi:hypothetical protein